MITNNAETYYERMSSTMSDKCLTLYPYLFNGITVLDFGAGKDLSIAKMVEQFNGKYIPVDNSSQVQEFFMSNGITCYDSIFQVKEKVNVIFLSSVFHELLSYLDSKEVSLITDKFSQLLTEDGQIILRDWNILDINEWYKEDEIIINEERIPEIKKWIDALVSKGIIKSINDIKITNNSIIGNRCDLYNILYHTTWGLDSLPRESNENYAITNGNLLEYFLSNGLKIDDFKVKWDDTYINYMDKYFPSYGDRVKNKEQWLSPKVRVILKKKN